LRASAAKGGRTISSWPVTVDVNEADEDCGRDVREDIEETEVREDDLVCDEDAPETHEETDRWSNRGDFEEEDSGDEDEDESDDAMLVSPATTSHATLVAPAPDVEMVAA